MKTLELFCGTKSFSKVMKKHGHSTLTVDLEPEFNPDVCGDILETDIGGNFDFIWSSCPCTAFSVSSIGTHWTGGHRAYIPKSATAILGLKLLDRTISIIAEKKPKYWCIENPRGVMRKVINKIFTKYKITDFHRTTISYCQYGDTRMKPTDIWTNIPGWFGKMCKNGAKCHVAAPRGSRTGTQGLKNAKERGRIPPKLFEEILKHIKKVKK